eukprot:5812549-Pleurochrysis_carterae.AAC.1
MQTVAAAGAAAWNAAAKTPCRWRVLWPPRIKSQRALHMTRLALRRRRTLPTGCRCSHVAEVGWRRGGVSG